MWGLVEGHIGPNTTIYESSSGNTATSEAYFAQLLNLSYVTVLSYSTSVSKLERIKKYGGDYIKTDLSQIFKRAKEEAKRNNGFYMNQFLNADKAEEYHESSGFPKESTNMFHEVLLQLQDEKKNNFTFPDYFVQTSGTGGTITSVGRYIERYTLPTKVVLADTEFSVYYDYVVYGMFTNETGEKLWITPGMEGTGFGYAGPVTYGVSTSLQPSVIDRALKIPDLASTAAMHFLRKKGVFGGTSTGVNFVAALSLAAREKNNTKPIQIVTVLCDSDTLYKPTYYNETWINEKFVKHGGILTFKCWEFAIEYAYRKGIDPLEYGAKKCKRRIIQEA
uniref:Tryptophan synthase beta chain-like PALP domain-containing protein n=1 Tax=Acrobeloides nanus TaxID=290746 RepID=A0A914EKW7_9BILA